MGRLAGFSYREAASKLRSLGFRFDRQARGSHEIWRHPETLKRTTLPNHPRDVPEDTLSAILREAGVSADEFLNT